MNLTIKQLRAFVYVADAQSFSLAAQRLNLTPGAVSLLVRDLEEELGFPLFDRTTRRVALSRAGRDYLAAARKVMDQVHAAVLSAQDVKNRATGVVRVAAPLVIASLILPPIVASYRKLRPGVQVRPVDCTVENLATVVEEDQTDISIGPDRPTGEHVRRVTLYPSPWVLWCHPDHPIAKRRRIAWAALTSESVIAAGRDYEHGMMESLPTGAKGARFAPSYIVDNITTALGMVASGLGVTLSPMYVDVMARGMGLVMRRVGPPELLREVSLYLPHRRNLSPAAADLCEFLHSELTTASKGSKEMGR